MRKFISFITTLAIIGVMLPAANVQAAEADWYLAKNAALDFILQNVEPYPGVGGEWSVIALARANRIDIDDPWAEGWSGNLEQQLTKVESLSLIYDINHPPSAGTFPQSLRRWTDFQRISLALSALGINAADFNGHNLTEVFMEYVPLSERHALNQTVNADTFALIALNAGPYAGDVDEFLQSLLAAQREDGTWSLTPSRPSTAMDMDITIMALQALAPFYSCGDELAEEAVYRALDWLRMQDFNGTESISQMIIALTALGYEFAAEAESFVEKLLAWFDPEAGGFRRPTQESPVNFMSTEQAACALVAYWRFVNDMPPFYMMSDARDVQESVFLTPPVKVANSGGMAGLISRIREFIQPAERESFAVFLTVRADILLENMDLLNRDKHELIPPDGVILPLTEARAYQGDTVFDVLQREMRNARIHMAARSVPMLNSSYVEAINNIYEFDAGPLSGWMFRVNQGFPGTGASSHVLNPGDEIIWLYTLDLGRDIGEYAVE